uniref:Uncharacterized protein n=1 Tax=Peronospora matthiolae TaxID=2874970 RepID=A0AAV1U8U5_9STRA
MDLASKSQKGKKKLKSWTRDAHSTRGASKRAQSVGAQEEQEREESVVAHIFERDPKNYGKAMRSSKREGWDIAMREEIEALEEKKFVDWSSKVPVIMHCKPNGS